MLGHSYVFWALRYNATSQWGSNLSPDARAHIEWRGHHGMLWDQLCRVAAFERHQRDVLVIHLGATIWHGTLERP